MVEEEYTDSEISEEEMSDERYEDEEEEDRQAELSARLDAFGESLARTRSEAIAARQTSGLEEMWLEDDEYYEGIDDANRGTDGKYNWRNKPPGSSEGNQSTSTRSTVFPNITSPFVDAASARISDMLLPTDDRPWEFKTTPKPDLVASANEDMQMAYEREKEAVLQKGLFAKLLNFPEPPQPLSEEEEAELVKSAKDACLKAQARVEDWHIECQWHAEVRKVIEDSARIGTGVLKGPVPFNIDRITYRNGEAVTQSKINPGSNWVDPYNFFPHGACGDNIHNGSYVWERDFITKKQLRELARTPGYLPNQILKCLEEGPQQATAAFIERPESTSEASQKDLYEIWYYHGTAEKEDLEAAGKNTEGDDPHQHVVATLVNNHCIRASQNPLDNGDYPYDVMVWRRKAGSWAGSGVARQCRVAQNIIIGATRNLMDNAGIAAGPMLVFKQGVVTPADGVAGFAPRKVFFIAEDDDSIMDATKAIGQIKVDMMVDELLRIVNFGMKLAEDTTGLPQLLQGQMGGAPDTVGGMTMLDNNASSVLRRLARQFDDRITEPHLRRYYIWLLQYGKDESEKGDFIIDARGSSALVERDLKNQELAQMAQITLDPRFGLDPKKYMDEYLKSRRFDTHRFKFDDEKWEEMLGNWEGMMEAASQPPDDSKLQIAQMQFELGQLKIQSTENISAMKYEVDGAFKHADLELKSADMQTTVSENDKDRQLKLLIAQLGAQVDGMSSEMSSAGVSDKLRASLAETVMKLKSAEKLAKSGATADKMPRPSVEPPGKAKKGESYQS